jgi:predicted lipid-binding transport protein (Tim44 family)
MLLEIIFLAVVAAFIVNYLIKTLGREDTARPSTMSSIKKKIEIKDVSYEEISVYESSLSKEIKCNLEKIKKLDKKFNLNGFLTRSKEAFKIIIESLNKEDEKTLNMLLHPDVWKVFSKELKSRKETQTVNKNTLISVLEVKILDCALIENTASIKVEIKSEQIKYIQDKGGNLLTGNKCKILELLDHWTFTKNIDNLNDFWRLKETS